MPSPIQYILVYLCIKHIYLHVLSRAADGIQRLALNYLTYSWDAFIYGSETPHGVVKIPLEEGLFMPSQGGDLLNECSPAPTVPLWTGLEKNLKF